MGSRTDALISNDYSIQRFSDMPAPYQMAIIWFMAVDGEAWDGVDLSSLSWDDPKSELIRLIPEYVALYGETLFGSAVLSASVIQESIMGDCEIAEDFSSWEEYHSSFLAAGAPEHPESDRWPLILSGDDGETLRDGWHRFHSYVRDGATVIPCVFFPEDRHLSAVTGTMEESL